MRPIFSVVIPTYNRPRSLHLAIASVLNQHFNSFEILIMDNASRANIRKIANSFQDKRVRYFRHRSNLGYARNLKSGFQKAQGKYVFILSDDDFILNSDAFTKIHAIMEKTRSAIGELAVLYFDNDFQKPSFHFREIGKKLEYRRPSSDILLKTSEWNFGFISGHTFRREYIDIDNMIDDVWTPYLKMIYKAIKKHGCVYINDVFIIAKISKDGLMSYLNVNQNKGFHMESMFRLYREHDSSLRRYKQFLDLHLKGIINNFFAIKYYTSNKNVVLLAFHILRHEKKYLYNPLFWTRILLALLVPKFLLHIARSKKVFFEERSLKEKLKTIHYSSALQSITDLHKSYPKGIES